MKILHIATGYPIRFHGGITNYVRTLAASQAASGNDVTVVASPRGKDAAALPFAEWEFRSKRLRPFSLSVVDGDRSSRELLDRIEAAHFDIVHYHMGLDLDLQFFRELPNRIVPYIVTLHDYFLVCPRITMIDYEGAVSQSVDPEKCASCVGALDQIDALEKLHRMTGIVLPRVRSENIFERQRVMKGFLSGAARVLPVSRRVEEIVSAVEPNAAYRVMHIGNASAHQEPATRRSDPDLRVTFLGMLSHHKGSGVFEKILRGVRRDDLQFHFYGRGDRSVIEPLERLGLQNHGSYTAKDLPEIMRNSDAGLVLPIWEDNAPQVVMEFLNYGVPVFATRMGGIPDFVNERNGMLFDPHAPAEIDAFIERLQSIDRPQIEALARGTTRLTTPEQHERAVDAVYEEALRAR